MAGLVAKDITFQIGGNGVISVDKAWAFIKLLCSEQNHLNNERTAVMAK